MSIDVTTEKRFESDIEEFFLSPAGGYTHNQDAYDSQLGVYKDTLLRFIQKTQPKEWKRFLLQNKVDPERKFCLAFNNACDMDGLISVLRHGGGGYRGGNNSRGGGYGGSRGDNGYGGDQ